MNEQTDSEHLIPEEFKGQVDYGLYGGRVQYYIEGVDGTLAQLGSKLPEPDRLRSWIASAHRVQKKLVAEHEAQRRR